MAKHKTSAKTLKRYQDFAREYVSNGRNASQAYKSISPKATTLTAGTEGHAYLKKPKVQAAIEIFQEAISIRQQITAETVLSDLKGIQESALKEGDKSNAIRAVQEIAKILGFYAPTQQKTEHSGKVEFESLLKDLDGKSKGL